ncbi:MAG: hypothetical protein ABIO04_07040 [Ferruginibacter sp.]
MKRKNFIPAILFCCLSMTASFSLMAQKSLRSSDNIFTKGSVTANLGVGVGNNYNDSKSAFGTKAALEFGVWPAGPGVISVGLEIGGTFSSQSNFDDRNDFRSRAVIIAGRSAWHSGWNVRNLDTYAGVSAGVGFRNHDYNYRGDHYQNDDVIPVFGVFAGASYFFTPGFGVNIEAGHDITSLQAGVIFKLR